MGFAAEAEMDAVGHLQSPRRPVRPLWGYSGLRMRRTRVPWKIISLEINGRLQVSQEISIAAPAVG